METALVTGASGGIGLEIARVLAQNRFNLVLVARRQTELNQIKDELIAKYGITVKVIAKDLSLISSCEEIYKELQEENIKIDVLVNNAGFGDYGFFDESDWNKDYRMIELNIASLTFLTKLFINEMTKRKHGRILNVSSTAAFQPGPLMAVYYASKAYVQSFSEAIANELKGKGVTVTALCPGATVSGFQKAASLESSRLVKGRKLPTAKEVARFGFEAMMKGKTVAIHGTLNKLLAFSVRFFPRDLVSAATRFIQEKTKEKN
ncbi:MAG: SDR family oxidoreductase [Bacteroidota bacterium]|nr:SDR family oxidoreductase [Bacteroidota bacterium]MDP4191177.1 SDR family oxidoreductase [Bacteroidota bacterium]MDP4197529.1 SDR family oxidoreductase [Bacteroidota bacterium]